MRTYVTLDASECPFLDPNSYPRRGLFELSQRDEDIALKELPRTWKKGLDFMWVHYIAQALEMAFVATESRAHRGNLRDRGARRAALRTLCLCGKIRKAKGKPHEGSNG